MEQFKADASQSIFDLEMKLGMIIKWLKDSGLKANKTKTDLCSSHRNDTTINMTLQGVQITSKKLMNVPSVTFD
jgi:hypothetical protein